MRTSSFDIGNSLKLCLISHSLALLHIAAGRISRSCKAWTKIFGDCEKQIIFQFAIVVCQTNSRSNVYQTLLVWQLMDNKQSSEQWKAKPSSGKNYFREV